MFASGLVVVDMDDPLKPKVAAKVALPDMRASALQFRYLFVTDARGMEVLAPQDSEAAYAPPGARVLPLTQFIERGIPPRADHASVPERERRLIFQRRNDAVAQII